MFKLCAILIVAGAHKPTRINHRAAFWAKEGIVHHEAVAAGLCAAQAGIAVGEGYVEGDRLHCVHS